MITQKSRKKTVASALRPSLAVCDVLAHRGGLHHHLGHVVLEYIADGDDPDECMINDDGKCRKRCSVIIAISASRVSVSWQVMTCRSCFPTPGVSGIQVLGRQGTDDVSLGYDGQRSLRPTNRMQ